jgi:hypothetical protein
MRQRERIVVSTGLLTLFLLGYLGVDNSTGKQSACDASGIPQTVNSGSTVDRLSLNQDALCVVTSKARQQQSYSADAWSNDPAEMYVRSLPQSRRSVAAAASSSLSDTKPVSTARYAGQDASTKAAASGPGGQSATNGVSPWLIVVAAVGTSGIALVLAVGLSLIRRRQPRATSHAALLNLAGYNPVAPADEPATASAGDKRRAA